MVCASSGEVVMVVPDDESGSVMVLQSRGNSLKLTWVPQKNLVRWDTDTEYGFEKLGDDTVSLARTLMRRLRE